MHTPARRTLLKALASTGLVAATGGSFAAAKLSPDAKSALIVVDVQNCFVTGGTLPVKDGEQVVPVINKIAGGFENVVLTQDWHPPHHASFATSWQDASPFSSVQFPYGPQTLWPAHCVQGTPGADFHPDLQTLKAEMIVRKGFHAGIDSYSAFRENDRTTRTGLEGYLKERGFRRLVI